PRSGLQVNQSRQWWRRTNEDAGRLRFERRAHAGSPDRSRGGPAARHFAGLLKKEITLFGFPDPPQAIRSDEQAHCRRVQRVRKRLRRGTQPAPAPVVTVSERAVLVQLEANSSASGSSLLSEIATLAIRARDRIEFRTGTLRLIREVIPYEVAFFQSAATLVGADPVGSAPTPIAARLLKRHASNVWSELATLRAGAAGAGGLLDASDLVSPDSELARLLRAEQPVRKLCVASLDEGRTVLVLGRAATPFLRRELE